MDQVELQGLKTRMDAARAFIVEVDGKKFHLRLPTQWDVRRLAARASDVAPGEREMMQQLRYELVRHALYGWHGVQMRDAYREVQDSADVLDYSAPAAEMLLGRNTAVLDALSDELFARINKRDAVLEDDAKNLDSASPTKSSATKHGSN